MTALTCLPVPLMVKASPMVRPPAMRTVAPLLTVVAPARVPRALAWLAIRVPAVTLVAPV